MFCVHQVVVPFESMGWDLSMYSVEDLDTMIVADDIGFEPTETIPVNTTSNFEEVDELKEVKRMAKELMEKEDSGGNLYVTEEDMNQHLEVSKHYVL